MVIFSLVVSPPCVGGGVSIGGEDVITIFGPAANLKPKETIKNSMKNHHFYTFFILGQS